MKTATEKTVSEWNSARTDGISAVVSGRSCLFGRGQVCDCCERKSFDVVLCTQSTSNGVGRRLLIAARSLRNLIPANVRVTKAQRAQFGFGYHLSTRPLRTSFRLTVWL